jgi:hypothetical protein
MIMRVGAQMHGLAFTAGSSLPRLSSLAAPTRMIIEAAYASGVAWLYLACVPMAGVVVACACLLTDRILEPEAPRP